MHSYIAGKKGKTNSKRIATPWSNGQWREESLCPFLWKLGPAYIQLFPAPWLRNGRLLPVKWPSLLSNGSYRLGIWQQFSFVREWRKRNRKAEGGSLKNMSWKELDVISLDLCLNSYLMYSLLSIWIIFISAWHLYANLLALNWVSVLHACPMGQHQFTWFYLFLRKIWKPGLTQVLCTEAPKLYILFKSL